MTSNMAAGTKESRMVPELRIERERSKLNVEELTHYIDGGEPLTERRREMRKTTTRKSKLSAFDVCSTVTTVY